MASDPHKVIPYTNPDKARRVRREMFRKAKREGGLVVVDHQKVA
jgi:hypothetical protein